MNYAFGPDAGIGPGTFAAESEHDGSARRAGNPGDGVGQNVSDPFREQYLPSIREQRQMEIGAGNQTDKPPVAQAAREHHALGLHGFLPR